MDQNLLSFVILEKSRTPGAKKFLDFGIEKSTKEKFTDKFLEFLAKNPNPPDKSIHVLAEKLKVDPDKFETMIYSIVSDVIEHGKGVKPDPKELEMGIKVESEHTKSPILAKFIAMAHLKEISNYYTRLATMEKDAKKSYNTLDEYLELVKAKKLNKSVLPFLGAIEKIKEVHKKHFPEKKQSWTKKTKTGKLITAYRRKEPRRGAAALKLDVPTAKTKSTTLEFENNRGYSLSLQMDYTKDGIHFSAKVPKPNGMSDWVDYGVVNHDKAATYAEGVVKELKKE